MANKTLRSRSTARVLDAVSEGPIWGLLDGDKSIYLNGTQLQNNGGSYNFRGVRTNDRKGTVGQDIIKGFRSVTNEISDGRQIENGSPITFDVSDDDIDAVNLKIRVNSLFKTTNKGKMKPNAVVLEIDRQPNGGSFTQVGTVRIKGRSTSAYDRHKRIELPDGGHPYTIRVRRITANSSDPQEPSDTFLPSYTLITDLRFRYPYTALVGIEVDAQKFGSSFPDRIYRLGGILIEYPSNYNPNTRAYTGVWDGTFTSGERCDNPAWILRDLATKTRYGLGNVLTAAQVDKWALYKIAQYCDGLVDDGNGGTEPRFRYNGVIETPEEAAKALDRIASVFRGMLYWQSGSVTFTNDEPVTSIAANVTPANVVNGSFSYGISAKKARHSTVIVAFNNPDKLGETDFEYVSRDHLVLKYGYNPIELGLVGCTSRSQAHRAGEWLLDSEEFETDLVTYTAGMDHAHVRPGHVVNVYDPWYAGARMGGRLLAATTTQVTLDAPYDVAAGLTHYIRVTLPDGSVVEREIANADGPGQTVITLSSALAETPVVGSVYGIANDDINPRQFRVISGTPKEGNKFEINALFYDPTKYDRVERNLTLTGPSYTAYDSSAVAAPTGLNITETRTDNGDEYAASAVLSWQPADDARVTRYGVQVLDVDDEDYQEEIIIAGTSFSYDECPLGELTFRVRSLPDDNRWAASAYVDATPETIVGYPDPTPYDALTVVGKFRKNVLKFAENTDEKFKRTVIYGSSTNNFSTATVIGFAPLGDKRWVEEDLGKQETRYYWIAPQDKYLRIGTRYPNTTAGISGTTVPIDDIDLNDTGPNTPGVPALTTSSADKDKDGKQETFLTAAWTQGGSVTVKAYNLEVYRSATIGGSYTLWKTFEVDGSKLSHRFQCNSNFFYKAQVKAKGGAKLGGSAYSGLTATGVQPLARGFNLTTTGVAVTWEAYRRKHVVNVLNLPINDPEFAYVEIYQRTGASTWTRVDRGRKDQFVFMNPPTTVQKYRAVMYTTTEATNAVNYESSGTAPSAGNSGVDDIETNDLSPLCVTAPKLADNAVTARSLVHNITVAVDKHLGASVSDNVLIDIDITHGDAEQVCVVASFINNAGAPRTDIDVSLERNGGTTFSSMTVSLEDDGEAVIFGRIGIGSLSGSGTSTLQMRVSGAFNKRDRKIMAWSVW